MPLVAFIACCRLYISCSKVAKWCCCQPVNMKFSFAMWFPSDPCTLWTWSWHSLLHKHVFLLLVDLTCHVLLYGEWFKLTNMPTYCCSCHVWICIITCHVYMGAIILSDPFWLMVNKELLLYAFSRFMPSLCLLRYVLVACCLLSLNMASWCYS